MGRGPGHRRYSGPSCHESSSRPSPTGRRPRMETGSHSSYTSSRGSVRVEEECYDPREGGTQATDKRVRRPGGLEDEPRMSSQGVSGNGLPLYPFKTVTWTGRRPRPRRYRRLVFTTVHPVLPSTQVDMGVHEGFRRFDDFHCPCLVFTYTTFYFGQSSSTGPGSVPRSRLKGPRKGVTRSRVGSPLRAPVSPEGHRAKTTFGSKSLYKEVVLFLTFTLLFTIDCEPESQSLRGALTIPETDCRLKRSGRDGRSRRPFTSTRHDSSHSRPCLASRPSFPPPTRTHPWSKGALSHTK